MKKNILFILIILILIGFIYYVNKPETNIYGLPNKTIDITSNKNESTMARLVACHINEKNSLSASEGNEFYKKIRKRFIKVPFKKIEGNELNFKFNIFNEKENPFNTVSFIFLDKNLTFLGKKLAHINMNDVSMNISFLPKESNIYVYITFNNIFKNQNFYATYFTKIRT